MTKVILKANDNEESFGVEHAQAILNYQSKYNLTDWSLSDKNFILEDGVLKYAGNNKSDKAAKEQTLAAEGNTAS